MTIEAIDKIELKPLDAKQTVTMFTDKAQLSLTRIAAERGAFNAAYIRFITSDFEFQRDRKDQRVDY